MTFPEFRDWSSVLRDGEGPSEKIGRAVGVQSGVTNQRGGDRLTLLNYRFGEGCSAAQCGGDDVGHPAALVHDEVPPGEGFAGVS